MLYPDPAALSPNKPVPVLFFIYGGGFTSGDRKLAPPYDLAYSNVGVFFAKRGYVSRPHLRPHPQSPPSLRDLTLCPLPHAGS